MACEVLSRSGVVFPVLAFALFPFANCLSSLLCTSCPFQASTDHWHGFQDAKVCSTVAGEHGPDLLVSVQDVFVQVGMVLNRRRGQCEDDSDLKALPNLCSYSLRSHFQRSVQLLWDVSAAEDTAAFVVVVVRPSALPLHCFGCDLVLLHRCPTKCFDRHDLQQLQDIGEDGTGCLSGIEAI